MNAPTHFVVDAHDARLVHPCRADGTRPVRPMRPGGAPPVATAYWSDADFERWRATTLAARQAFDDWHAVWAPCLRADVDPARVLPASAAGYR